MRIAIITIMDGQNYGNRLQNYALQETLNKMGYEAETIKRKTFHDLPSSENFKQTIKKTIKRLIGKPYGKHKQLRKKSFDRFNHRFLRLSKIYLYKNMAPKRISEKYDCFVVGSDQVWNAGFRIIREDLRNYLLAFARPEQRISYAASFGTDNLEQEFEPLFREELSKFKAISVREASGLEIARSLNVKATVVLDPVMLLTKEEWLSVSKKPGFADDSPYIVTYLSGYEDRRRLCSQMTDGIKVYNLDFEFCPEREVESIEQFATSPEEFIWLIANAEYILTDSFHGAAFSILFHKPFWVFERKAINDSHKMGNRIITLLSTFGLQGNLTSMANSIAKPDSLNGKLIDEVLKIERQKSLRYLKDALSE